MRKHHILLFLPVLLMLTACGNGETTGTENGDESAAGNGATNGAIATEPATRDPATASAVLRNRQDEEVGTVEVTETPGGIRLNAEITGLPAGEHGFHIHETGRCELPDFESAGGHFNPTDAEHGTDDPEGSHVGDMANLVVPSEGMTEATREVEGATLGDGPRSLLRSGGTAIVIHQRPDDYETDPSGASGPRIACGVIEAGGSAAGSAAGSGGRL